MRDHFVRHVLLQPGCGVGKAVQATGSHNNQVRAALFRGGENLNGGLAVFQQCSGPAQQLHFRWNEVFKPMGGLDDRKVAGPKCFFLVSESAKRGEGSIAPDFAERGKRHTLWSRKKRN